MGTQKCLYRKPNLKVGGTINSGRYCALLTNSRKQAIRGNRRSLFSKIFLCGAKSHPHTDARRIKPLTNWVMRCWKILPTYQISRLQIIISSNRLKTLGRQFPRDEGEQEEVPPAENYLLIGNASACEPLVQLHRKNLI